MKHPILHKDLEQALSFERFGRYLFWARGDREQAIILYTLNTKASEALYTPLQMLEVALRNRINTVMTELYHKHWFNDSNILLNSYQQEQLRKARNDLRIRKKGVTSGRIVAELMFGFWTAMLGTDYEELWQKGLHAIAKKPNGKGVARKELSGPLTQIRILRNRVAHHEPVINWNLLKHYRKMIEITHLLSPPAAEWCNENSRFLEVYPTKPLMLEKGL
ncbi:MAG TPA: Abi family protein [Kiloniellales bacterium]|nr:Abi family protein [Kiloniellales bacterium]